MNRLRTALALASVLALALAACGSEEQNDYVDEVNSLQESYAAEVTDLASNPASSGKEVARTADQMAELTTQLAADIEAVEPPDEVADLHAQLVDEFDGVADEIGKLSDQISGSDLQQSVEAATGLATAVSEAQTKIQSLINEINAELQG
jgi:hypothetical protein